MNTATAVTRHTPEPPWDVEAEQAILGAILVNNDAFDRVGDFLEPEHFREPLHQRIFEAIVRVIRKRQLASPITLRPFFALDDAMKAVGGPDYLAELTRFSPSIMNSGEVGRMIYDLWMRRQLLTASQDIGTLAVDPPIDMTPTEQIEAAEERIFAIQSKRFVGERRMETAKAVAMRSVAAIEAAYQNPHLVGVDTGLESVDRYMGPLLKSDLIVLAGHTSMGKTALAQQIGWNAASRGMNVLFESYEMTSEQCVDRYIAQIARVPASRMETGRLSEQEMERIVAAGEAFNEVPLFITGLSGSTTSGIRGRARRLARLKGKLHLIIADHLRFMIPDDPRADEKAQVQQITRDMKAIAKDMNCPVLLVAHLNRDAKGRSNKRPINTDLYGASAIEQNADTIAFVYRPEYWLHQEEPDASDVVEHAKWAVECERAKGKAECIVTKRRRGRPGTGHMMWDAEMTHFYMPNQNQPAQTERLI